MDLDQLKTEASKDLIIEDEEHLDSESLKNQKIKSKYLDHKTRYQLLLQRPMVIINVCTERNGSTMVASLM